LTFENVSYTWTDSIPTFSNGAVYTDLDNDEDLEVVVNNINDGATILKNNAIENQKGNFLKIKFSGNEKNKAGVGTIVNIHLANGEILTQQLINSRGFLSTVSNTLHFGLNPRDKAMTVGRKYLDKQQYALALKDFQAADEYPENQSIGRQEDFERQAQIFYYIGLVQGKMGNKKLAKEYYQKAIKIKVRNTAYNYEKALSLQKIGQFEKATELFKEISEKGAERLSKIEEADFFSKFGGEETQNIRKSTAHHLAGLGQLGKNKKTEAIAHFKKSMLLNPGNYWAGELLKDLQ